MLKIDAHQHFWNPGTLHYPWLAPDLAVLYRPFVPADLVPHVTAHGVDGTIVVQATHDEAETTWLLELATTTPWIAGVVGWVDLASDDLAEKLGRFIARGPLCGVRHQVHDEPDPHWLLRPEVIRGLQTLARRGLVYDLLLRPMHLPILPRLFEAVPGMRWVIDHLAKPEIKSGRVEPWLSGMREAARYPNVFCKISGMITEADHTRWTADDIRPYFEHVLELFGPSRLMWGSDWPVCLLAGGYERVHDLAQDLIVRLPRVEQAMIWGATARAVYQLENAENFAGR